MTDIIQLAGELRLPGRVSATDWVLPTGLSEGRWKELGRTLGRMEKALGWWIGAWWMYGDHAFRTAKAIVTADDWEGPAYETCRHAANCCRSVPSGRRRPLVSFSHHLEVASVEDAAEQDRLLLKAETEELSVRELRQAVREIGRLYQQPVIPAGKFETIVVDPPWEIAA